MPYAFVDAIANSPHCICFSQSFELAGLMQTKPSFADYQLVARWVFEYVGDGLYLIM